MNTTWQWAVSWYSSWRYSCVRRQTIRCSICCRSVCLSQPMADNQEMRKPSTILIFWHSTISSANSSIAWTVFFISINYRPWNDQKETYTLFAPLSHWVLPCWYALHLVVGNKGHSQNLCHHSLPNSTLDKTLPMISERHGMISSTHGCHVKYYWQISVTSEFSANHVKEAVRTFT